MGDITLRKALDDYKSVYMANRKYSARTMEEYLNDLGNFLEFSEERGINQVRSLGLPIIE